MRDTDRDRVSHLVVRAGGPVQRLEDLRGRTLAVGAKDSPQGRSSSRHAGTPWARAEKDFPRGA
jgi:hypothetical protein